MKVAVTCSIPALSGDGSVTPPHEWAAPDRQGATTTMMSDSVQQDMFTVLHGQETPVVTRWSYTAADPFAVCLAVRTGHDRWVEWLVARELVVDALCGPAGEGDVRMSTQEVHGYDVVQIEIHSPDGHAVLEVDRDMLRHFVEATMDVVPLGDEPDHIDLDGEIEKITRSRAE